MTQHYEPTSQQVEQLKRRKRLKPAIDFYNANATNVVNVPRVDHPEDPSGIAGVRRCMEARFFAEDALVMSLSDACQFAEAYASSSRAAKPEGE